jgi:hypothetical protein
LPPCGVSLFSDKVIDKKVSGLPYHLFKGDEDSGLPDSVGYFFGCPNYAPPLYAGAGIYAALVKQKAPVVYYELPGQITRLMMMISVCKT